MVVIQFQYLWNKSILCFFCLLPNQVFKIYALIIRFNLTNHRKFLNIDTVDVIILYSKWLLWGGPGKCHKLHTQTSLYV